MWYGGRGSAKTNALIKIGILESFIDDGVILCCREIQKSIADSLYSAIVSLFPTHASFSPKHTCIHKGRWQKSGSSVR